MIFVSIVLLVILILLLNDKENLSILASDQVTNNKIVLQETYTWPCTGCSTSTTLKPRFKYNLTDGRCITTKVNDYSVPISKLIDINVYITEPGPELQSCDTLINTMYSSVLGRYIILENSTPFTIMSLKIQNKSSTNLVITSLVTYTPAGPVDNVVNLDSAIWPITKYIIIDLRSDINISQLKISHGNQTDANAFVGTKITIAIDTTTPGIVQEVFSKTVTDASLVKTVYTQSNIKNTQTRSISREYNWPSCTYCTTQSGLLYKGSNYTLTDSRCFKLKDYSTTDKLSTSFLDTLNTTDLMNQYFLSCNTSKDTRQLDTIKPIANGILAWFDAQSIGTIKNNSGNNASNNESVLYWNDRSSNGYNLSQTIQSIQPIYITNSSINGKPSVYFNNKYINNTSLNPGTQYFTIFSVHTGGTGPIWDLAKDSSFEKFFPRYPDGNMYLANISTNWAYTTGLDTTRPYICAVRYTNTPSLLLTVYSNTGGRQTIFNEVTYTPNLTFRGGFSLGVRLVQIVNYFNGNIGEIILYNRSLTNAEIDFMISYFRNRWSI